MKNKLTDIGFISKAQGFAGEVLCVMENDFDLPDSLRFLFITLEGKPVPFLIEYKKERNGALLLKFEDVDNEVSAKKLSGHRLAAEADLVTAVKDHLQWDDLIGYAIQDKTFGSIGTLLSVEEYPEQMVGRCVVNEKEVLFPLIDDFIEEIDEAKKTILLNLPEGLLGIYLDEGGKD